LKTRTALKRSPIVVEGLGEMVDIQEPVTGDAPKPVWVGLLDVRPLPGNDSLDGQFGAYVHVLAPADSWEEFAESARQLLETEGWEAIEADEIRPAREDDLSENFWALAQIVSKTQLPALDDTFHSYPAVDEED
jgi:hypothetical protein